METTECSKIPTPPVIPGQLRLFDPDRLETDSTEAEPDRPEAPR